MVTSDYLLAIKLSLVTVSCTMGGNRKISGHFSSASCHIICATLLALVDRRSKLARVTWALQSCMDLLLSGSQCSPSLVIVSGVTVAGRKRNSAGSYHVVVVNLTDSVVQLLPIRSTNYAQFLTQADM